MNPVVYNRGDARLDAVVEFVDFAARALTLTAFLDEAPAKIAQIFGSPVCSIYLMEPGAAGIEYQLVMRGNLGFPALALGEVRLAMGEGITGMAVSGGRPISVDDATHHESYRQFEFLREERFPVFLVSPILTPNGAIGAVVVQREVGRVFDARDVELLVALSASFANAIQRAELLAQLRDQPLRGPGGGTRRVTLPGKPLFRGVGIGAIAALRRPASRPRDQDFISDPARIAQIAFETAQRAVASLRRKSDDLGLGIEADFLNTYLQILEDRRFLERARELISQKKSVGAGMSEVAREVTRAARVTGDSYSEMRSRDIEDLCDAITMLACSDPRAEIPSKAVLIGDRITVYDLLVTAKNHPMALALSNAANERTRTLAQLLGVPAVSESEGLFKWAADGDLAMVDGDHGFVVLNPPKADVQQVRSLRE